MAPAAQFTGTSNDLPHGATPFPFSSRLHAVECIQHSAKKNTVSSFVQTGHFLCRSSLALSADERPIARLTTIKTTVMSVYLPHWVKLYSIYQQILVTNDILIYLLKTSAIKLSL